ncbi:MAG TPA: hypothetical protein VF572_04720 [Candidatus Saccharimonadales bacterium]|jgi:2'-5' RNA ligase
MDKTQVSNWLGQKHEGYAVNTEFSDQNAAVITRFLSDMQATFGEDIFVMPRKSMHITLLDWIAPLLDYGGQDKSALYEQVYTEYDAAMSDAIGSHQPFNIRFNELAVFPNTVVLLGLDDGQFADIRRRFVDNVRLLPDTKLPPQIIHSSLIRFRKELDMDAVKATVAGHKIDLVQPVTDFRLVHTTAEPLAEFEIIKRYHLS